MPITEDIRDHDLLGPAVRRGLRQGRVRGRVEGREEGRAKGRLEGRQTVVTCQIEKRFGPVPEWALDRLEAMSSDEVEETALRLLDARELEDLTNKEDPGGEGPRRPLDDLLNDPVLGPIVRSFLLQGLEDGRAEGRLEGRAEGRLEGRAEGGHTVVMRQIEKRFGALPEWARQRLHSLSAPEVEAIAVRLLDAPTLQDVFGK